MWFNPCNILRTNTFNRKARVEFKNGLIITVPSKLYSFNHKLQTADQFRNIMSGQGDDPFSKSKGPKKGA